MRVYQAAQQLGVKSTDLLELLKSNGVDIKSPASTIDDATFDLAYRLLSEGGSVSAPIAEEPPPPPPKEEVEEPVPIPTRAGKVGTLPTMKGGKGKVGDVDQEVAAGPVVEPEIEPEESAVETAPPVPIEEVAPAPTEEPPQKAAPQKPGPTKAVPQADEPPRQEPPTPRPAVPPPSRKPVGPIPTAQRQLPRMQGTGRPPPTPGTTQRRPPLREGQGRPSSSVVSGLAPSPSPGQRPPSALRPAPVKKGEGTSPKPVISYRELQEAQQNRAQSPATPQPDANKGTTARHGSTRRTAGEEEDGRKKKKSTKDAHRELRLGKRELSRLAAGDDGEYRPIRRKQHHQQAMQKPTGPVVLETPITVRSFSAAAGITAKEVLTRLFKLGSMATINTVITEEQAQLLAMDFDIEIQVKGRQTAETIMDEKLEAEVDDPGDLVGRPPIVTFMGHVDHGKTSLMDRIRRTDVAAGEAGGITQHIGAYQVRLETGAAVTFLDTPGHQAFTAMRARGANLTDIVVLVVAADDGVMPQTQEAISHAQAANVPIVVAVNKSDLPGANPDRVSQQLTQFNIIAEKWGGDTPLISTSAATGQGIPELLETLVLVADLKELKANPKRSASGNCVEASLDRDAGVRATVLVRNGTLKRGDVVLCGATFGRARAMYDDKGVAIEEAGPSTPVVLFGLDSVPEAGQPFVVVDELSKAREIATQRRGREREANLQPDQMRTLESLFAKKHDDLNLIVKADTRGSIEALRKEIGSLTHSEVRVRVIHDGVGAVNESDVELARASDAIIVAFHVIPDNAAERLAADRAVEIRRYEIIYNVIDDIKKALEGLLKPESREVQLGRAVVKETFSISRVGTIAGCYVDKGIIERVARLRVIRDGVVIGNYPIESLKRIKDDVREVRQGLECGIKLAGFDDVKVGDLLEAFKVEEVRRKLDG